MLFVHCAPPRRLAGRLHGGQQQGDQHRDDRDDDQQFDQGESLPEGSRMMSHALILK